MKKIIFWLIVALGALLQLRAQDAYYYYRGGKEPLSMDMKKVVSITSKDKDVILSSSKGFSLLETVSDQFGFIRIYEVDSSAAVREVKESGMLSYVSLLSCYRTEDEEELIPNGYINVKLKSESDYGILQTVAEEYGCIIIEQNPFMPLWYKLKVDANSGCNSVDVANSVYETGKVAACFPSFLMDALEISYDPNVYEQWGLYNSQYEGLDISLSQAWNYATGRGVTIAIVDQGIDLNHKDLMANISPFSYDTETHTSPSKVYGDHGTHCAGIAAAVRNNGIQVTGVAPDAKLMSVSNKLVLSVNYESNMANGINWAWKNGADIISCSWRCYKNELIEEAIDAAVTKGRGGKGCVFVKSAGNTGGAISYPGDYAPYVLAVANMTVNGTLSTSSSHGSNLFVTAPGTDILSTVPNNGIRKMSGTSMACPHVAGVAALILERNPKLTAVKVREIIAKNAKKIGSKVYDQTKVYGFWNEYYGYGLVDAYKAVINTPR